MDLLVRYSEIHTKKGKTRSQLVQTLRQRIQDRLNYEGIQFEKVSIGPGRIIVTETEKRSQTVSELPGVKSCSLTQKTKPNIREVKNSIELEVGSSFGVRVNSRTSKSATEWERKLGAYIQEKTGSEVDLDKPETWVKVEIDEDIAYVFTDKTTFEGPGGLPAASQGKHVTLISGGIDSPVAAFETMKRGSDIFPLYFYNRPYAAEDHLLRFEKVLDTLKRFHPSKKWEYVLVDLKEINEELSSIGKGRMILHRRLMFEVAERIREDRGLDGIITGESMAQKSSQTPRNFYATSNDLPILRPLLTWTKEDITEKARDLDTFQYAQIDSACSTISPESPSTEMSSEKLKKLKSEVDFKELVDKAVQNMEVKKV